MPKPTTTLRAAAQRRFNRQAAAVAETVRAWQALREVEEAGGDARTATLALCITLDNLEREMEKSGTKPRGERKVFLEKLAQDLRVSAALADNHVLA